jgi:hypothetical protein
MEHLSGKIGANASENPLTYFTANSDVSATPS